jgi:hypothetical protein
VPYAQQQPGDEGGRGEREPGYKSEPDAGRAKSSLKAQR